MKLFRLFLIAAMLLPASALSAADGWKAQLAGLLQAASEGRVTANYDCKVMNGDVPVLFTGKATLQGACYHLTGNGMEIWCDGNSVLIADAREKEAYIQQAADILTFINGNFSSVSDLKLSLMKKAPASEDMSEFTLPLASFGQDWVVTDLSK